MKTTARLTCALLVATTCTTASARERSEIPERYTWDLADLYPSEAEWEQARAEVSRRIARLSVHRGHLGDSAEALARALDEVFEVDRALSRLLVYATSRSDEDTRATHPLELRRAAEHLAIDFSAATAFVHPELLAQDEHRLRTFTAQERLAPYRHYLEDVLRWKAHTLPASEERIAAEAGALTDSGDSIYELLKDADLPYRTVTLSTRERVRMDEAAFTLHRASRIRADRDRAFTAYLGALHAFERTFGATLAAQVRGARFKAQLHGFDSDLEASLFGDAIPVSIYRRLLDDTHRNLPTLHRYLALRQRVLGLRELRYQDLYVPWGKTSRHAKMTFSPEEARALTLAAVAPLGPSYQEVLRRGFARRWTDFLPSTGKRTGAYSSGVYGVHPYQLLNFNGTYEDLSTLAHESGHSMHTWLASSTQPYVTSNYPTFVAEVASTLNEDLLAHYLLDRARDDATRLFLLGKILDELRGTLFRQVQFAEFELALHDKVARGEELTGENLSALYLSIARTYYGHAQGICRVDDTVAAEWAGVPHFYEDFYVFQYATSIVAATSIAKAIREEAARGETRRRDAYLSMLRAGGSEYAVDLLREAGVDMTTSAPFDAAIAEMNAVMDQMERLLARQSTRRPPP